MNADNCFCKKQLYFTAPQNYYKQCYFYQVKLTLFSSYDIVSSQNEKFPNKRVFVTL